jgi:integrase/recombinase XerD
MRRRLGAGRLEPFTAGYGEELRRRGYRPGAVRRRLQQFEGLGRWMVAHDVEVADLDGQVAAGFAAERRALGRVTWVTEASLGLPLAYLSSIEVASTGSSVPVLRIDRLLGDYCVYLEGERGVAADTVRAYLRIAGRFLRETEQCGVPVEDLSPRR